MKFFTPTLLLCSSLLLTSTAAQSEDEVAASETTDSETVASFEQQGLCAYYIDAQLEMRNSPLGTTCKKYCENNGGHGYFECDLSSYAGKDAEAIRAEFGASLQTDEDGDVFIPAPCLCDNEIAEGAIDVLVEAVIEGLKELDNLFCAIMVDALVSILEVGVMFVPGGQALTVARLVQGAKSFVENTLEASSFVDDWVSIVLILLRRHANM